MFHHDLHLSRTRNDIQRLLSLPLSSACQTTSAQRRFRSWYLSARRTHQSSTSHLPDLSLQIPCQLSPVWEQTDHNLPKDPSHDHSHASRIAALLGSSLAHS